jgi:hypothetical protein
LAIPRPNPELAPVTTTTLSRKRSAAVSFPMIRGR